MHSFQTFFTHELHLEWKQKHALGGLLLYVGGAVFLSWLAFKKVDALVWIALFWLILLFASVNAVARSFIAQNAGRMLYYYQLSAPVPFLLAKIAFNTVLLWLIALLECSILSVFMPFPVQEYWPFFTAVFLGCLGLASSMTMVSAISYRASNPFTLMAVLSFPVVIPVLSIVIKLSKQAVDGLDVSLSYDEIAVLAAIDCLMLAVSCLLFPYLWRE